MTTFDSVRMTSTSSPGSSIMQSTCHSHIRFVTFSSPISLFPSPWQRQQPRLPLKPTQLSQSPSLGQTRCISVLLQLSSYPLHVFAHRYATGSRCSDSSMKSVRKQRPHDVMRKLYMGRGDVTESMVTIRSPFCGYNTT